MSSPRGLISVKYWSFSYKYWSPRSRNSRFLHAFRGIKSTISLPARSRLLILTAYSRPSKDFIPPFLPWVKLRWQSRPFKAAILFSVIFWLSLYIFWCLSCLITAFLRFSSLIFTSLELSKSSCKPWFILPEELEVLVILLLEV